MTDQRRIAFLSNPHSGDGAGHHGRDDVLARLRRYGADVGDLVGHDAAESLALVRRAVADGVDTLVVSGGDGLIHLAVQALAGTDTALGVIPTGSGNDAARALGLPLHDPLAAADVVLEDRRRRIDLGRSGDRWFLTVMSTGFDAIVSARAAGMRRPRNNLRYTAAVALELPRFRPLHYTLDLDGEEVRLEAMFVALANTDFYGGGMQIGAGASYDDGLLDVVVITTLSRTQLLRFFPTVRTGQHVHNAAFQRYRARSVTVATMPVVTTYADGERFGEAPITVTCVPGALSVLV